MPNSISVSYSHTNEERKYVEAGITKDNKIAYRNNGSYYVVGQGDDGFKNVPATDVTTNYLISESEGRKGNPQLITIPKGQGTGNIEKILKKIEEDIEKDTK